MPRNDAYFHRGFSAEMRAAGNDEGGAGHIIEGLAAVCDRETRISTPFGEWIEVIRGGAFDETNFDDVRLLVNHDFNGIALARSRRNNKSDKPNTMQLTADKNGVRIKADLDTENNEQARALYSAIERGDMDGMSFCFFVSEEDQEWERKNNELYRYINKVESVIEVSVVNFPAYPQTEIDTRSLESDKMQLESCRRALESARNSTPLDYKTKILINQYGGNKK